MEKEIILNANSNFNFCFEHKNGRKFNSSLSYETVRHLLVEEAWENLPEEACNESSCQVNGFCECGSIYDETDFYLKTIIIIN